jgi:DNA-binding transcriptional MerR regulator
MLLPGHLLAVFMATQTAPIRVLDPPPAIPDRLYFKIGDVARLCGVETYVLRFWETQFPQLKPNKSGTGQRLYRRRDVEIALDIQRLVHGQGYTLSGARQVLEQTQRRGSSAQPVPGPELELQRTPQPRLPLVSGDSGQRLDDVAAVIGRARAELRELAGLLASPDPQPPRRRPRLVAVSNLSGTLFPSS